MNSISLYIYRKIYVSAINKTKKDKNWSIAEEKT